MLCNMHHRCFWNWSFATKILQIDQFWNMASNLLAKSAWTVLSRRSLYFSKILAASSTPLLLSPQADLKFKPSSQRRSLSTASTSNEPPKQKPVEEKINSLNQESQNTDSSANSEDQFDEDQVKRTILLKALDHVPKNGFTMDALEHGKVRVLTRNDLE